MNGDSSVCSRGVGCGGVPGRVVSIEIPKDEGIILGLKEEVEGGLEARWTGGSGGDVNVEYVELVVIYDGSDGEVFCGGIVREKMVRRKVEEFD